MQRFKKFILPGIIIIVIIVIIAILGIIIASKPIMTALSPAPTPTMAPKNTLSLPKNWKWETIEDTEKNVGKLIKINNDTVQPSIVIIESTTTEKDPKAYVNKLIEGLKQTVAVTLTKDTESKTQNPYERALELWYMNGADKIAVKQLIVIDNGNVRTITASYNLNTKDNALEKEIQELLSQLSKTN